MYYVEEFEISCPMVNEFHQDDSSSVAVMQDIFKDSQDKINKNNGFKADVVKNSIHISIRIKDLKLCEISC
jgi:hypothetical protein